MLEGVQEGPGLYPHSPCINWQLNGPTLEVTWPVQLFLVELNVQSCWLTQDLSWVVLELHTGGTGVGIGVGGGGGVGCVKPH